MNKFKSIHITTEELFTKKLSDIKWKMRPEERLRKLFKKQMLKEKIIKMDKYKELSK